MTTTNATPVQGGTAKAYKLADMAIRNLDPEALDLVVSVVSVLAARSRVRRRRY